VVTTSARLHCALHEISLGVVKVSYLGKFQPESGRLFAIGRPLACAGLNVAAPFRRVSTPGDNSVRRRPTLGANPAGANDRETTTINRCPFAGRAGSWAISSSNAIGPDPSFHRVWFHRAAMRREH